MLTILGKPQKGFCDGLSRRTFLKIGGLALGGLSMPQILRAEAASGTRPNSHKAIIMIFLPGGPPHQDIFDLKMDAPAEVRGEFKPIHTNVAGIEICELFPLIAQQMDKLVPIRSIVGASGAHDAYECLTGIAAAVSSRRAAGPAWARCSPSCADPCIRRCRPLSACRRRWGTCRGPTTATPGFLGVAHAPFKPDGEGKADMVLNGVTLDRLGDRKALLTSFDRFRREADASGMMQGLDNFNGTGLRRADLQQADGRPGYRERRPQGPRALRQGRPEQPQRRRPQADGAVPDGAAAGRGGYALRDAGVQPLGPSRRQLWRVPAKTCRCSIRGCRPWSTTCTSAAWTRTCRWSCGASSAARRRSTRTPAATTGRKSPAPVGRRRHADRPGDRLDRSAGRRGQGPARPLPGSVCHALSTAWASTSINSRCAT